MASQSDKIADHGIDSTEYDDVIHHDSTTEWVVKPTYNSPAIDVNPDDSVSQICDNIETQSQAGRSHVSRCLSILSARLQEQQKRAEIKLKMKCLEKRKQLELTLQMEEEQLKLDTEMAISQTKLKLIDNFESDKSVFNMNVSRATLRANAPIFTPMSGSNLPTIRHDDTVTSIPPPKLFQGQNVNLQSSGFNENPKRNATFDNFSPQQAGRYVHNHDTDLFQANSGSDLTSVIRQLRKPASEMQKFDGNPLLFRRFMRQFCSKIVTVTDNDEERMNYLEQYTCGEAHKIVSGYSYLDSTTGYSSAVRELEQRYGNNEVIANAFIKRALDWPPIKADNAKSLDEFGIFLSECENAVHSIEAVKVLEYPDNIKKLVTKFYHDRWRSIVLQIRNRGDLVTFSDFAIFIKTEARKVNDPTYGKEALRLEDKGKPETTRGKAAYKASFTTDLRDRQTENTGVKSENKERRSAFTFPCLYCDNEYHSFENCDKLRVLPHEDRINFLKSKKLCFGCLKFNHMSKDCRRKATCKICRKNHPSICHIEKKLDKLTERTPTEGKFTSASASAHMGAGEGICTMAIIPVSVRLKDSSKTVETLAFLDPGSSATFCTENLMRSIGAQGIKTKITLDTMAKPFSTYTYAVLGIEIGDVNFENTVNLPKVYTKDRIPVSKDHFPRQKDLQKWQHLQGLEIPEMEGKVGLLIGNNVADAYIPLEIRTGPNSSPFAVRSKLGWVFWCLTRGGDGSHSFSVNKTDITAIEEIKHSEHLHSLLEKAIKYDFPEESYSDKREHSQEDKRSLKLVDDNMMLVNSHYVMPLPFRSENVYLPDNKAQAFQRLKGIRNKMLKNENFYSDYCTFMKGLFEEDFAEIVPVNELHRKDNRTWYIPHHGVYHPRKKGKIRVVFDCAAQYLGVSLNNLLFQGPDLTNNLLSVLLRFREGKIALMSDIKSMFHQVRLPKDDRDCLRFLWYPNGDLKSEPVVCRMKVHLFGAVSSPSCCNAALKRTAIDNTDSFNKGTLDVINNSFYVDDCLKSVDSEKEAIQLAEEVTSLCEKGGFRLHKWVSNSSIVLQSIPTDNRAKEVNNVNLEKDDLPNERALGVYWSVNNDSFGYDIKLKEKPATRRGILSVTSSLFDSLGFVAPFTLIGKGLLHDLCHKGLGWDEPITGPELRRWEQWLKELPFVENLKLPRCYRSQDLSDIARCELHVFSDASEKGYGVVAYLRFVDRLENIHCSFVLGKSRVVPLKTITIPRLELTAATLAAKLSVVIQRDLEFSVKVRFWTDSVSVVRYIRSEVGRFKTFVANRVNTIREISDPEQWSYIETKLNPADAASRGQRMKDFSGNSCWFNGPSFLWQHESTWQKTPDDYNLPKDDPEIKQTTFSTLTDTDELTILTERFSSWWKLKRVLGWVLLFTSKTKDKVQKRKQNDVGLSPSPVKSALILPKEFIEKAETCVIKHVQRLHFEQEIDALKDLNKDFSLKKTSTLLKLDPFVVEGVLRVGGRLRRATIDFGSKHPIVLPKNSHVSRIILQEAHLSLGHVGKNHVMSQVRETYWIIGAGSVLKSILSKCVTCRKYSTKVAEQKMADLPTDRLAADEPPFSRVGMDFFGPVLVKQGRSIVKRYGVIFSCLASRAVHLEIASSMDTDSCINSIRRFVARRGKVKVIRSDNGTNLVGSKNELKEEIRRWNQAHIHGHLQQKCIKWEFNPPAASHFGGSWERMIRSVRKILYALLQEQSIKLNDESLHTLFCEVEMILNSRPLTDMPSDPNDLKVITPQDLLTLHTSESLSPGLFERNDSYVRRRWRQVQFLADVFWKRWTKEYLPMLQQRKKWLQPRRNIQNEDIVLIVENSPRNSWSMGRVIDVTKDKNGYVRSATVKTKLNTLVRPIDKLCLLIEAELHST